MEAKIVGIGHSLGVVLPRQFLNSMGLEKGDIIKLDVREKQITVVLRKKTR